MAGKWRLLWSTLILLMIRSSWPLSEPSALNPSEEGSVVVVAARRGATARLPCAITSGHPFEPPLLVLWYRDSSVTPAYSFDSRPSHNTTKGVNGRQWADEEAWGGAGRAWLNTSASPAHLVIVGVHGRDEGVYRCVVHFRAAPSWTQRVALSVVDPAGYPRLQDVSGRRLEGPVGPYEEGDSVRMVCEASGEPPPRLVWGGEVEKWEESKTVVRGRVSRTEVRFVVSRDHLHASVTCSSFNASSSSSSSSHGDDGGAGSDGHHLFTATALLKLKLAPLEVRLEAPGEWVTAGQVTSFRCVVMGSSPPPVIQWRLNERYLDTHTSHLQERGNVSVSTLKVRPQYTDDGEVLECRAYSPALPSYALQHSLRLSVHFVPVVTLTAPGKEGESAAVPQGSSVTLSCHLEANPPASCVTWFHNGRRVHHLEGVSSNVTLHLSNVTAPDEGLYTCVGSNVEGDGQSNALHLAVLFRPVCASDSASQHYEVELGGAVTLRCCVESLPPPLTFTWAIRNATDGSLTRLLTARRGEGLTGRYTLRGVAGTLEVYCWAKNAVGTQHTPCRLTIRTYRALGDLRGCGVTQPTSSGFTVACSEVTSASNVTYSLSVYAKERRRDNGRKKNERDNRVKKTKNDQEQHEEEEEEEGRGGHLPLVNDLVKNLTAHLPFFHVGGLRAGRQFVVELRAWSEGIASPPTVLSAHTIPDPDTHPQKRIVAPKHPGNTTDEGSEDDKHGGTEGDTWQGLGDTWVLESTGTFKLVVFVMFLSAILVLTALATCAVRRRRDLPLRQRPRQEKEDEEDEEERREGRGDAIFYIHLRQKSVSYLPARVSLMATHEESDVGVSGKRFGREKARGSGVASGAADNTQGCSLCTKL